MSGHGSQVVAQAGRRAVLKARPPDMEGRAAHSGRRIKLNPAAVSLHQAFAQRESDSGVFVGIRLRGRPNAWAVVPYREYAVASNVCDPDGNVPGRQVMVPVGIADEITQHAFERCLVGSERLRLD